MKRRFYVPHLGLMAFLWTILAAGAIRGQPVPFERGEIDGDGQILITDAIYGLNWLFLGETRPSCVKAADANDDGAVDLTDAVYLLGWLFLGGPGLPPPSDECGLDPTADDLSCLTYKPCEGLIPTETVTRANDSDNRGMVVQIRFPLPQMTPVEMRGQQFTHVAFAGVEAGVAGGDPSRAGLPQTHMLHRLLAVPEGTQPVVRLKKLHQQEMKEILLFPQQPSAADEPTPETFMDPEFEWNDRAYRLDGYYPPAAVQLRVIGKMRDVNVAMLSIAATQYNPARMILRLNDEVEVEVDFEGDGGAFVGRQSASPFEAYNNRPLIEASFLNGPEVYDYVENVIPDWRCVGEELLIITHPDFKSAADDLAAWKMTKGISTSVYETGPRVSGKIGTTVEEIRDFIRGRYSICLVRPSYVLLLGDAEYIPPFYRSSYGSSRTGTDLDYSLMNEGDLLSDLAVGRIPVDTLTQANTVVDKIINYEQSPPTNIRFYETATFAAYFQCCRGSVEDDGRTSRAYIETMERILDELVDEGYEVERLYSSDTQYHPSYPPRDTTPRRYFDGTALPAAIGPASGFAWDADSNDILDAFDAGRFLVFHRNHGGETGWVAPAFDTADVASLSNGDLLPVLFSVDCATGFFDNETAEGDYQTTVGGVYFIESILRKAGGGVVGALGDTRNSPTWANNALTRGFADAIFPDVLSGYGGTTPIVRLGDILLHGKLYMFSQVGVSQTAGDVTQFEADSNNIMWHVYGDPTQEIWTSYPYRLSSQVEYLVEEGRIFVLYEEDGTVITALQAGSPVARSTVEDGQASLDFMVEPEPGVPLDICASKLGAVSIALTSNDPLALQDEGGFTGAATRITFERSEGLGVGDNVTDQYQNLGVVFEDEGLSVPKVVDDKIRGGTTHSGTQSLLNTAEFPQTSAGIPLVIRFERPVQRVGMYIGNGASGRMPAVLVAFGEKGEEIFRARREGVGNDVDTFIGLDVRTRRISGVALDYGNDLREEEIDDLLFE